MNVMETFQGALVLHDNAAAKFASKANMAAKMLMIMEMLQCHHCGLTLLHTGTCSLTADSFKSSGGLSSHHELCDRHCTAAGRKVERRPHPSAIHSECSSLLLFFFQSFG